MIYARPPFWIDLHLLLLDPRPADARLLGALSLLCPFEHALAEHVIERCVLFFHAHGNVRVHVLNVRALHADGGAADVEFSFAVSVLLVGLA